MPLLALGIEIPGSCKSAPLYTTTLATARRPTTSKARAPSSMQVDASRARRHTPVNAMRGPTARVGSCDRAPSRPPSLEACMTRKTGSSSRGRT